MFLCNQQREKIQFNIGGCMISSEDKILKSKMLGEIYIPDPPLTKELEINPEPEEIDREELITEQIEQTKKLLRQLILQKEAYKNPQKQLILKMEKDTETLMNVAITLFSKPEFAEYEKITFYQNPIRVKLKFFQHKKVRYGNKQSSRKVREVRKTTKQKQSKRDGGRIQEDSQDLHTENEPNANQ